MTRNGVCCGAVAEIDLDRVVINQSSLIEAKCVAAVPKIAGTAEISTATVLSPYLPVPLMVTTPAASATAPLDASRMSAPTVLSARRAAVMAAATVAAVSVVVTVGYRERCTRTTS